MEQPEDTPGIPSSPLGLNPDPVNRYNPTGGVFTPVPLDCPECKTTLVMETSPKNNRLRALFCPKCRWMPKVGNKSTPKRTEDKKKTKEGK